MKARLFFALAFLLVWLPCAPGADGLKPSDMKTRDALHAVITGQLDAFRAGDYRAAYVFADREIRSQFPLERFEQMVKTAYPTIAQSVSANFGLTFDDGDEAVVNVRVVGADQKTIAYQYMLRRDGEAWRITGVALLKDQTTEV
jgi:hypothetical protein